MALDQEKGFQGPDSSAGGQDEVHDTSQSSIGQVPSEQETPNPEPVVTYKTWIVACVCVPSYGDCRYAQTN